MDETPPKLNDLIPGPPPARMPRTPTFVTIQLRAAGAGLTVSAILCQTWTSFYLAIPLFGFAAGLNLKGRR
jgi:hypothetical protein